MFEKPTQSEEKTTRIPRLAESPPSLVDTKKPAQLRPGNPAPGQLKPTAKIRSVIGSDVVFKGELLAGEDIVIEGCVEGSIARHSKNIIVGKAGRVKAEIHAHAIKIEGRVDGNVYGSELVELVAGAEVQGDIFCSCVHIEKGARFNGAIKMA